MWDKLKRFSIILSLLLMGLLIPTFVSSPVKAAWWSPPIQLTSNLADVFDASISDDGSKIVFSSDVDGDYEIFVINSDGTGLTQLTYNTATDMLPFISDDGSKIAYLSREGFFAADTIFVINSDGTGLTQLIEPGAAKGNPSTSSDGSKIAFSSYVDDGSELFIVSQDTNAPTGSILINGGESVSNSQEVTLTLSAFDEISGVTQMRLSNDGTSWSSWESYSASKSWTLTSGEGTKTVYVQFQDGAGLTSQYSDTIALDILSSPDASFTYSPESPEYGKTVTFDASSSSDVDGSISSYAWNFGDGSTAATATPTHVYNSVGNYTITLTVTDDDALTDTATKTIFVIATGVELTPPSASFTFSPSSPKVDETVSFDASTSSDSDGSISSYSWNFGDGSTGTVKTVTHAYTSNATYTVTLTVTDNDELTDTETKTITVRPLGSEIDDVDPVADAGNDRSVNFGSAVPFSAAASSDNVGIASYEWDFGDGNTSTGVAPSHTYEAEGDYIVTLTVKDAAGNSDTDTILITVKEAAPAGFPFWILILVIVAIVAVIVLWFFFKKRKPKEKAPKPTKIRVTVDPKELLADGKSKSSIIIELLDKEDDPVPATSDTEIKLNSTMGMIEEPLAKIPKGKDKGQSVLVSSKSAGEVTLSAQAEGLQGTTITVTFKEKIRYCMHCSNQMSFSDKKCPRCGKSPPAGVDTKVCKKCGAVIPAVAKYCPVCATNQAKEIRY